MLCNFSISREPLVLIQTFYIFVWNFFGCGFELGSFEISNCLVLVLAHFFKFKIFLSLVQKLCEHSPMLEKVCRCRLKHYPSWDFKSLSLVGNEKGENL
jgi:hypothetical protein